MKAKELAEELLNYPDFDVELTYMVFKRDGIHTKSHTMEKKTNFTSTLTRNLKISVLNSNKFRFFPKVIM